MKLERFGIRGRFSTWVVAASSFVFAVIFCGCLAKDECTSVAGVSGGCGNPPGSINFATGDVVAEQITVSAEGCGVEFCGAGLPIPGKPIFGLKFGVFFDVGSGGALGLPAKIQKPYRVRFDFFPTFSADSLPFDSLEFEAESDTVQIPAAELRRFFEAMPVETGEVRLLNVRIHFEGRLSASDSEILHRETLLRGLAFGPAVEERSQDPGRIWPGLIGTWPEDSLLIFREIGEHLFVGALSDDVLTRLSGVESIRVGVPGSPYWSESNGGAGSYVIKAPSDRLPISAMGTLGGTVLTVPLTEKTGESGIWTLVPE
jgi:hypothetical protein